MTEGTSSSNRAVTPCDAVIMHEGKPVGPIRLPDNRGDDFIDHFNRTYQAMGMSLIAIAEDSEQQPSRVPE